MAYGEGLLIGHRWYDATGIEPAFAFGHGLSYTQWQRGAAMLEGNTHDGAVVSVPVHNVGDRAGTTVLQCYVEPVDAQPGRPVRTLQAFARVHAAAGEECTVRLELPARAFSRWSPDAHSWVPGPGEHRVLLGWSSSQLTPVGVSRAPGPA